MSDYLADILRCVNLPARSDDDPANQRQHNWGFTIYRTAYGGDTEASWNTLLQTIRDDFHERTDRTHEDLSGCDPLKNTGNDLGSQKRRAVWEAAPKAMELFRLDPRSDQSLLENASPDQLRGLFKEGALGPDGKPPVTHEMGDMELQGVDRDTINTPGWRDGFGPFVDRMFLVADAEVLEAVAAFDKTRDKDEMWVKLYVVDIDQVPEDEWWAEAYCGWTKLTVYMLLKVWGLATRRSVLDILPRSSEEGRDLDVWHWP